MRTFRIVAWLLLSFCACKRERTTVSIGADPTSSTKPRASASASPLDVAFGALTIWIGDRKDTLPIDAAGAFDNGLGWTEVALAVDCPGAPSGCGLRDWMDG